jgi:cytochrome b561
MNTPDPTPTPSSAPAHHSRTTIALHWLMFGLFVTVFASIELRVLFEKGTAPRDLMKSLHFTIGLVILALALWRMVNRWLSPKPVPASGHAWTHRLAQMTHWALYAVMLGMPMLGWLSLSAGGKPIMLLGLEWPALIAPDKDLAKSLKNLHETIGVASYWLIGLHITAALGHQWVLKDGLLNRMGLRHLRSA